MSLYTLDLNKLESEDSKIKYGFAKELLKIGEENPILLYDDFDRWKNMMRGDNLILKWIAIDLIGYVSAVDQLNKLDQVFEELIHYVRSGQLIVCSHAIFSLGLIAGNKPEKRSEIINELLAVSNNAFDSDDCKDIAIGKVLITLKNFIEEYGEDKNILRFIKEAQSCNRLATRKKADLLMNRIEKFTVY